MSAKSLDAHGRWRNITVAFRVSPEEDEQIERLVRLTGLTKQDYIMRRLTEQDVVVQGNPRVFAALQREMRAVLDELSRLEAGNNPSEELIEVITMISRIMAAKRETTTSRIWRFLRAGNSRSENMAECAARSLRRNIRDCMHG